MACKIVQSIKLQTYKQNSNQPTNIQPSHLNDIENKEGCFVLHKQNTDKLASQYTHTDIYIYIYITDKRACFQQNSQFHQNLHYILNIIGFCEEKENYELTSKSQLLENQ